MKDALCLGFCDVFKKKPNSRPWLEFKAAHKLLRADKSRRQDTFAVLDIPGEQQVDSGDMLLPCTYRGCMLSLWCTYQRSARGQVIGQR